MGADRRAVSSPRAPAAIGPYSQAIVSGGLLFSAGQIALDPATGAIVGDGDAAREAEQALRNLAAVLEAAGASFGDVLRCDLFLADMDDFQKVNEVYARWFPPPAPARVTMEAARLPRGARVEIAVVARVP